LGSRRYSHSRRVQARRNIDLNAPNSVSTPQSGGARSALSAGYESDGNESDDFIPGLVSNDEDSDFEHSCFTPNSLQTSVTQRASTTPSAGHIRRGASNERSREEEDEAHVQCGQRQGNMLWSEQLQPSTRSMVCWHTVQVYPDAASLHKDVGSAPQPYNTSTINMLRHVKWVRRCPKFSKLVPSKREGTITEKFCCSHHITTGCPAVFRSVLHPDGTAHLQVPLNPLPLAELALALLPKLPKELIEVVCTTYLGLFRNDCVQELEYTQNVTPSSCRISDLAESLHYTTDSTFGMYTSDSICGFHLQTHQICEVD
jgi:hypothetical protein